jgi:uncharacterized membrane protein YhaH (DUF805 family)
MGIGQLLFGFNGRIRRTSYWLGGFGAGFVGFVIFMILFFVLGGGAMLAANSVTDPNSNAATAAGAGIGIGLAVLLLVYWLIMVWISLALHIKRWHDRDKSGVWVLIGFVPLIGFFWSLIECGFLDGTPGPNKYGPSPKGLHGPAQVF